MEIRHDKEGVHYPFEGKYLTIMSTAVMQYIEDDTMITNCAQAFIKFNQALGRLSSREVNAADFKIGQPLREIDISDTSTFIKYISKGDYDNYYSKGQFRLGTSKYYRTIENEKSRDGFEGFNCSFLHVNQSHIPLIFFRCNNYLILCGSFQSKSSYLKEQFGEIEMKIKDTAGFCKAIKDTIGAKSFIVGKIQYSNARIYKSHQITTPSFEPNEIFQNPEIMKLAMAVSILPSLFVKPESFSPEEELRIVFEMANDFTSPLSFENQKLLEIIEFS